MFTSPSEEATTRALTRTLCSTLGVLSSPLSLRSAALTSSSISHSLLRLHSPNLHSNFYGYLSSQTMQGLAPNPFQMLLFMYSADVILMDIPFGMGYWANLIAGAFCSACRSSSTS